MWVCSVERHGEYLDVEVGVDFVPLWYTLDLKEVEEVKE
jgi:hypothetical protein